MSWLYVEERLDRHILGRLMKLGEWEHEGPFNTVDSKEMEQSTQRERSQRIET